MAEIKDLHQDLSTELSVFTLKIGLQNLTFLSILLDYDIIRH